MRGKINEILTKIEKSEITEATTSPIDSLKPILSSLKILFDQINEKLDASEASIMRINFGFLFKQELDQITKKINENTEYLINLLDESTKEVDISIRDALKEFNTLLKSRLVGLQQTLQSIIQKTPEKLEQVGIFKAFKDQFRQKLYESLNSLGEIIDRLSHEATQHLITTKQASASEITTFLNSIDSQNIDLSAYKQEIDSSFNALDLNNKELGTNEQDLKRIEEQIQKYKPIYTDLIRQIESEIAVFQKFSNDPIRLDILKKFDTTKDTLKTLTTKAHAKAQEIEEFTEEISVGSVFSEDVDLLNDEIYDKFIPLIKDLEDIAEKNVKTEDKTFNDLRLEFKERTARIQAILDDVVKKAPTNIVSQVEIDKTINKSIFPDAKKLEDKIMTFDLISIMKKSKQELYDSIISSLNGLKSDITAQQQDFLLYESVHDEKLHAFRVKKHLKEEEEEQLKREEEERLKKEEEGRLKKKEEERRKKEEEEEDLRKEAERIQKEEEERLRLEKEEEEEYFRREAERFRKEEERLMKEEEEHLKREEEEDLRKEAERLQKEEDRLRKIEEERALQAKKEGEESVKSKEIPLSETPSSIPESENLLLQGLVKLIQSELDIKKESKKYQRWIKGWDKVVQLHILNEGYVHVLIRENQMEAALGKSPRDPDIVMEGEYKTISNYLSGVLDPILMFFDLILLRKMRIVKGLEIKLSNILSGNIVQQARDLYRIDRILKIK